MKEGKKTVFFITSTFPVSEKDTQAPWIGMLVRNLQSAGVAIDVFVPSYSGIPQLSYFGVPVYRFRYAPAFFEILAGYEGAPAKLRKNPLLYPLVFFYIFFGFISFFSLLKRTHYDVIHINWPLPHGFFGIAAKLFFSSKLILTFYGAEFALADRIPLGNRMLRFVIKQADTVTAISNSTREKVQELENIPVIVIPPILPFQVNKKKLEKHNEKGYKSKKTLLFVGRLIERKGLTYLIDAFHNISFKEELHLNVVGEGPLRSVIQEKINALHLQNKVTLYGSVSEKKLRQLYRDCDVFVLPAITDSWGDTEGFGVVILEAMSYAKPVIASRVGGIPDMVKDRVNGLLVSEKDSKELARAILLIIRSNKLRENLAKNAVKTVKNEFSSKIIIHQIKQLYLS